MNTRILPYLPLSKPITGADAARQFDADVFERFPRLGAYVRLPIDREFDGAPAALRYALTAPLQGPFLFVVEVTRGAGSLFEHQRQPVQVRAIGFDPRRDGLLRDGFLSNGPDRPAEPPMSKGDASHLLYAPPTR